MEKMIDFEEFIHTRTKKFKSFKKRTLFKIKIDKYKVKDAVRALQY